MKIQPLNGFCAVKVGRTEDRTASGLYIPDKAQVRPTTGEIVAISLPYENEHGVIVSSNLKIGMKVIFNKFAAEQIEQCDPGILMAKEKEMIGIIDE